MLSDHSHSTLPVKDVVCTALGDRKGTAVVVGITGGSEGGLLLDEVLPPALDGTCTTLVCIVASGE